MLEQSSTARLMTISLEKSIELLDMHKIHDIVTLITLVVEKDHGELSQSTFHFYVDEQREGIPSSAMNFTCILKACVTIKAMDKRKPFKEDIAREGLLQNKHCLGNGLMGVYAKRNVVPKMQEMPNGLHSWNAFVTRHAQEGHAKL